MKPRTSAGIVLIVASFAFYGAAGYLLMQGLDEKVKSDRQKQQTINQCIELLETLPSSTITPGEERIGYKSTQIADPRKALNDATVAAIMCPTHEVKQLCIGDKCGAPNEGITMKFTLELK